MFGVARCLFESNFPVDRVSGSYRAVWNAFKRIAAGAWVDGAERHDAEPYCAAGGAESESGG